MLYKIYMQSSILIFRIFHIKNNGNSRQLVVAYTILHGKQKIQV